MHPVSESNQRTEFLVPSAQGHIITVVAEPVLRFATHFSFWLPPSSPVVPGRDREYPWNANEIGKFCKDAARSKELQEALNKEPLSYRPSLNSMSRQLMGCVDCGTTEEVTERFTRLLEEIRDPDSTYHVVVSDRLHESLILLKRDYHFQLADLAYVSRNTLDHGYRSHVINDELGQCIQSLNHMDAELYKVVVDVHERNVKRAGHHFRKEVSLLDDLAGRTKKACEYSTSVSTFEHPEQLRPYARYCRNEGRETHFANDGEKPTGGREPYRLARHPLCTQCSLINGMVSVSRMMEATFRNCSRIGGSQAEITPVPPVQVVDSNNKTVSKTSDLTSPNVLHVKKGDTNAQPEIKKSNATRGNATGVGIGQQWEGDDEGVQSGSGLAFVNDKDVERKGVGGRPSKKTKKKKKKNDDDDDEKVWSLFSAGMKEEEQRKKKWHKIRDQAMDIVSEGISAGAAEDNTFEKAMAQQAKSDEDQVRKSLLRKRRLEEEREQSEQEELEKESEQKVHRRKKVKRRIEDDEVVRSGTDEETPKRRKKAKRHDDSDDGDAKPAPDPEEERPKRRRRVRVDEDDESDGVREVHRLKAKKKKKKKKPQASELLDETGDDEAHPAKKAVEKADEDAGEEKRSRKEGDDSDADERPRRKKRAKRRIVDDDE
eukprot:TRINITY_DN1467_c1_g1_i2.p2 TRINITY_DN1467_c1_g1~~TRINITY_DN1467_c1_g1_i2.p2  ORF type:complete len:658 (+),score=275.94 TRINITY_DN1467_c1_g1_i2:2162-4135(+)